MAKPKVSDTAARTGRAGGQLGVGFAIVDAVDAFHPLTTHQFGALVVLVALIVTFVQNLLENRGVIPSILKRVPPPKQGVPVVDTQQ